MQQILIFFILFLMLSCSNNNRQGIPKAERNYDPNALEKDAGGGMTVSGGVFVFAHLNADSIADAIHNASIKYFGESFSTKVIRDSVYAWLAKDFFSQKTYLNRPWTLYCYIDRTKTTCNYRPLFSLEKFDIDLFFENKICLRKLVADLGTCRYVEDNNGMPHNVSNNRLRFLCDFRIDIRYKPASLFNTAKQEYYRVTLKDTVDLFTELRSSDLVFLNK
ncbi:MAG: hypothetical protein QM731_09590 [Chitinophagaceae bacterium]